MFKSESWSRGLLVLDVVLVQKITYEIQLKLIRKSWNSRFLVLEWFLVYIIPLYIKSIGFNTKVLNFIY